MSKFTHINPDNMAPYLPYGLSHAVAVEGGRTVYLSGQVGWDETGGFASDDLIAQAEQALRALSEVASQWVIGLPSSTRLQAHYRLLHDEHKKARKALEESLECARRIMLPLDEAMALLDLGRCRGVPPSQQIQYLKGAHRILTRLNCHNRALIAEKAIETLKG